MAPMPDDDSDGPFGRPFDDYPPTASVTKLQPSMFTTTYVQPMFTKTMAYCLGFWVDGNGGIHTYSIEDFDDLSSAASFGAALQGGSMPTGDPWDSLWPQYWNGYYSSPATRTPTGNGNLNQATGPAAATTNPNGYSSAAQTGLAPSESPQNQKPQKDHDGPPVTALAVGIIVPIIVCILTITACIFCVGHYRRKARRLQAANQARGPAEMQEVAVGMLGPKPTGRVTNDERAYLASPTRTTTNSNNSTVAAGAGAAIVPIAAAGALGSQQEPPVILSTTMNNGFFTGIDTSDAVSINDTRSMASHDTFGEEPPPPYRPRSVPPISRETSVRNSIMSVAGGMPNRNSSVRSGHRDTLSSGSIIRRSNEVRSPFDDPEEEDEDTMSEASTVRGHREMDRLSIVSDLSYQNEPSERSHFNNR